MSPLSKEAYFEFCLTGVGILSVCCDDLYPSETGASGFFPTHHGVSCGYYGEYGDCLFHTAGMLWGRLSENLLG